MEQAARKGWYDRIVLDLGRQMRWSFVPPLMVYLAYGVSTLTAIVGTFFVKDYLGLSAAFLAGLGFWAGIPWALKMPLGHLVDLMWRWKSLLIFVGAALISASLGIMYLLITRPDAMGAILPPGSWYVTSVILAPAGYVIQDAVADAMSVEAVPTIDEHGRPVSEEASRAMHTTMQTLGRFALISGTVGVALLNIVMFSGAEGLPQAAKAAIYARIYLIAQVVPLLSISGVVLAALERRARAGRRDHHRRVRPEGRAPPRQSLVLHRGPCLRGALAGRGPVRDRLRAGADLSRLDACGRLPDAPVGPQPRAGSGAGALRHRHHHLRLPRRALAGCGLFVVRH